ncbi:MAG: hypothetical protein HN505_02660 [Verrucomicrobia bacterium]|nr:hypothetical protein [Verrucomicrobiota bacterium]
MNEVPHPLTAPIASRISDVRRNAYLQGRLYLGMLTVGSWVVFATLLLVSGVLESLGIWLAKLGLPEFAALSMMVLGFCLIQLPFDWLGGHWLPRRYGLTSHFTLPSYCMAVFKHSLIFSASINILHVAGQHLGLTGALGALLVLIMIGVQSKADAMQLVDRLFREQKERIADRLSQPLAERISLYLQSVFGPEAEALVHFEGNTFKGIRLQRNTQGAFEFMSLSGGAREQVAAAVRLAIAELLAMDYDNSLPIVFDDAFAYSDPDRVQALQRMLYTAADRGLQVIILTCNPSDYAGLGATCIRINAPVQRQKHDENNRNSDFTAVDDEYDTQASESIEAIEVTEQDQQLFLETLKDLGSKAGNKVMMDTLGWSNERYDHVKSKLIHLGLVTTGRGRGGTVLIV